MKNIFCQHDVWLDLSRYISCGGARLPLILTTTTIWLLLLLSRALANFQAIRTQLYCKVVNRSMSRLVAVPRIFRLLIRGNLVVFYCDIFGKKLIFNTSSPVYCLQLYGTLQTCLGGRFGNFEVNQRFILIYLAEPFL